MDIDLSQTTRQDFSFSYEAALRWNDFDRLQHLNNVTYHRLHEIVITRFLAIAGLDWLVDPVIPFVVENACCYCRPIDSVDSVVIALRVARLGRTSLCYQLAIFEKNHLTPASYGYFVHVFIDRVSGRSVEIPENMRSFMNGYMRTGNSR